MAVADRAGIRNMKMTATFAWKSGRTAIIVIAAMALTGLSSCQTVSPVDALGHPEWMRDLDSDFLLSPTGEVLYINHEQSYVILQSTVMPQAHEEFRLFRNGEHVGRVRISERSRPPFVAADILEGVPESGDIIRR